MANIMGFQPEFMALKVLKLCHINVAFLVIIQIKKLKVS